jgi:hypothetical protein
MRRWGLAISPEVGPRTSAVAQMKEHRWVCFDWLFPKPARPAPSVQKRYEYPTGNIELGMRVSQAAVDVRALHRGARQPNPCSAPAL